MTEKIKLEDKNNVSAIITTFCMFKKVKYKHVKERHEENVKDSN